MPLTITRAQRDAIYEMVITHLTAIGDVWLSVKRRDFADAKEMGRKSSPRTCGCSTTSAGRRRSTTRRSR